MEQKKQTDEIGVRTRKLAVISFTERGEALAGRVKDVLADSTDSMESIECMLYTKRSSFCVGEEAGLQPGAEKVTEPGQQLEVEKVTEPGRQPEAEKVAEPLGVWVGRQFEAGNGILFIGACGIAVRGIAEHVRDKLSDIPVLVADEAGRFVIPLLSGHYGGANELAEKLAGRLFATAVVTTATDVNRLFAVDVFARKNGLWIANRDGIARVSAKLLDKGQITMSVSGACMGNIPPEVTLVPYPPKDDVDVLVAPEKPDGIHVGLYLVPRCIVLGMGCKKGKQEAEVEAFVRAALDGLYIPMQAVMALATIDRKAKEKGFLDFAKTQGILFKIYPKETLAAVKGEFPASSFVEKQVGVENVCERAAMCAAGEAARLLLHKTAEDGKTLAVAEKRWSVNFDEA